MTQPHRFIVSALLAGMACTGCFAQESPAGGAVPSRGPVAVSEAALFYEVLLGEMNSATGNPSAGYAFVLDAARKTNDPALFKRAVEIAVQARAGDAALLAARAWSDAQPESRDANRYVLRLLVELNRIEETSAPLRRELALTPAPAKNGVYAAIPGLYARTPDKDAAVRAVQQALADDIAKAPHAPAALAALGRMQLLAGDTKAAFESARKGSAADPSAEEPALLALELLDRRVAGAEDLVRNYIAQKPMPEYRMTYARVLIELQRYSDAAAQMEIVTREKPELPEAWLIQATLQSQNGQNEPAEAALQKYLALVAEAPDSELKSRGTVQAYLLLAQIAEKRKDFPAAEAWLARIEDADALVSAQTRRASLLAAQGKLEEARALIRNIPERNAATARTKVLAEVQLLRDNRQYRAAYDLLATQIQRDPDDAELLYDQAMLADKLGDPAGMERLLRDLIARKPDYHNAYNALGYALAEKGERLDEAKALIQKALEYAPADPYISDSLAWVEFRMGNKREALTLLEEAFRKKPDAEIAAHLGEVLWSLGERERATTIWRQGLALNAENETLLETLKRFRVAP